MAPDGLTDVILIMLGVCLCVEPSAVLPPHEQEAPDASRVAGTTSLRFGLNTDCSPRKFGSDGNL